MAKYFFNNYNLFFNKFSFVFLKLLLFNDCTSQVNLVSNSSFENNTSCPTFMLQWDKCIGWTNCNGNTGSGFWGTPDYYHSCGTPSPPYNSVPPNTGNGFCNPHSGSAMMGLVCYNPPYPNYREYISTQLSCSMTSGNTYTVSFWITASAAPTVKYNSSHFGVYLSSIAPVQSSYFVMNLTPQYEITTIVNNVTWQQHTFTINPATNLNYITLGCFRDESIISTSLTTSSASQPYSNYFIDDIEILGSSTIGTFSATSSATNIKCNGAANGSASVTVTGSGTYNYLWSPGSYTTSIVNSLNPGIYVVSINDGGCNTSTTSVTITQPPVFSTSLTANSYTICENDAVTLNVNTVGGTPSYSVNWNTGSLNTNSIIVTPVTTSPYSYTVTDANLCIKTATASVIVYPKPTISLNSQNICSGITTTLIVSGALNYIWQPGNIVANTNVITPSATIIYTINGTSLNNCTSISIFTINVNPAPVLTVNSQTICLGQQAILNANSSTNTYLWLPNNQTSSNISEQPNTTSTYTVLSSVGSCSAIAISTVNVYPLPVIITNSNVSVCIGQTYLLNVSGASTYTWIPANTNGNTLSISPISNSVYTVAGTSINGCINSASIPVNIVNSLNVTINSPIICEGENALLIANSMGNIFHWKPSLFALTPNNSSTIVNPIATTVFTLDVSYNGLCNTTATTNVFVNHKPIVSAGNDTVINMDEMLVLIGKGTDDFGWVSIDGSGFNCNYCHSITVNPQNNTCYVLESRNVFGCKNYDTVCVSVTKDWAIYIPNAFSPTGDGKNDIFLPVGYGIIDYELNIFNRWGELIFKSDEDHNGWNGSYKGVKCEMGIYTYKIFINTQSSKYEERIGHVTLISNIK
jgi:gliding motility-associated-like protein